jgi:hypothetical protein
LSKVVDVPVNTVWVLKSALRDFVPDGLIGGTGSSFAKRLGRWLKRISTRRWGNIELIPVEDKHDGVWK